MSKRSFSIGRRALLLSGASAFVLSACSNIIGPPEAAPLYVLKPASPAVKNGPPAHWQLTVVLPESSDSLDTTRIMLLQPGGQMDYYANANWQDRLPFVVQGTLVEAFEASGRMPAVGRDTEGLKSDFLLVTDIRDFQARYDVPDTAPVAMVRIVAKVVAARTRTIVMSIDAHSEIQAGQNSVPSVVGAFNQALSAVQARIVEAVLNAPPPSPAA
ncbi:MAG: ABC-type transport auxiliary lipoprotein family protein [Rhizomicrobium sp.]